MAPNSEETGRVLPLSKSRNSSWNDDTLTKEKQRPPIYNPEDYALSLKKWGRRPAAGSPGLYITTTPETNPSPISPDPAQVVNATQRDYRNLMLTTGTTGEMTLRQFGTVSELLTKLRSDLRLAFPSFVQEFIGDPLDGVTLLLELLRAIQLSQAAGNNISQSSAGGNNNTTGTAFRMSPALQRRALLDELACLQCLVCCCQRYTEAIRRLTASSAGLFTLAVCIMSNVNKSRIFALELLTKACEPIGNGHTAVSEALSTLRLRFGEPVRFRFLIGMLTSAGHCELLTAGLKFLNTFLESANSIQRRLYIQAELEQAGFDIASVKKLLNIKPSSTDLVFIEVERWEKSHIDIETISKRVKNFEIENNCLKDKVTLLERRIKILQEEKGILVSLEQCLKERCCELQDEVISLKSEKANKTTNSRDSTMKFGNPSLVEDEGISSSERSVTPEDIQRESLAYEIFHAKNDVLPKSNADIKTIADYNDEEEETTIEEVMEELQNIINNAENEAYISDKLKIDEKLRMEEIQIANSKIQMRVDSNVLIDDDELNDNEAEIVPCNLQPQPPRRTRSLVHLYIPTEEYEYHQKEMYFENETQFISDESSDSLLSASKCQILDAQKDHKNNNRELLNTIMDARDRAIQQEKRRQRKLDELKALKRSESLHHTIQHAHIKEPSSKTVKQNSFDGMYYVTSFSNTPISTPVCPSKIKTEIAQQKIKSKSLDRIDDGLDAMVDIIVTSDQQNDHRLQSDSGHVTETTILSRSTSNFYSHVNKDFNKIPPLKHEENKSYLNKIGGSTDSKFYFPRVQDNNFLIKRGHVNAGLYSGKQILNDTSAPAIKLPILAAPNNYRTNSCRVTLGKLTDLPSGLY